jgi:hypothetical protein
VPTQQDTLYGPGVWAFRQLNVPAVHDLGLRGSGVRVALFDTGFNTLHSFFTAAQVMAQRDFVNGDSVVRDQPGEAQGEMAHGTGTWSLIAADAPGELFGTAPRAQFLLAKTEFGPTETRVEEDNWVAAVEWADSIGVDIISSSLGYLRFDDGSGYTSSDLTGDIAVTTVAADSAAARGILVVISAGNGGPGPSSLGTPADADSAVAVGATDSLGNVVSFSSRGPTADGRIKPEVVGPGQAVTVAAINGGTTLSSGTSFSAPLVAGIAALVQETRPGRPAVELRRGLMSAGSRSLDPNNTTGHGIPDALSLLAFPTGLVALGPTDSTLTTVTPTFGWDAGTPPPGVDPDTFRLRVALDTGLATVVLDTTLTDSSATLPFAPRPGTRLYWHLLARSPLGPAESTAVIGPLVTPPWVTLVTLSGPGGASIRDSQPLFVWRSPAVTPPVGPFVYDVSVYPSSRGPGQPVATSFGQTDTTFRPSEPLERNLPFRWRVVSHLGPNDSVIAESPGTFVVVDASVPSATLLFQSFPNPFPNAELGLSQACIWFDVARQGAVRLEVFDLRGRLVRLLAPSDEVPPVLPAGRYGRPVDGATAACDPRFAWDGRDHTGAYVRPGVYLYRLSAPGFRDTKRLVFLGRP